MKSASLDGGDGKKKKRKRKKKVEQEGKDGEQSWEGGEGGEGEEREEEDPVVVTDKYPPNHLLAMRMLLDAGASATKALAPLYREVREK